MKTNILDNRNIYTDIMNITNINDLTKYCTDVFSIHNNNLGNSFTLDKLNEFIEELNEQYSVSSKKSIFIEMFCNLISSNDYILLRNSTSNDSDAYTQINNIMRTLHYLNGEPLTCDEYNYFDHYDRYQDFLSFYNDEPIYDFITNGENIYIRLNISFEEVKSILIADYDGSNYEHDFKENKEFDEVLLDE